jgi:hypothetical protein
MKQFKFLTPLALAATMVLLIFSCNSGTEKKAEEPAVDTTTAAAKTPEPAVVAPAMPDNYLVITHKVANFAKWKPNYESHDSVRRSYGLTNYALGRGAKDSNMAVIILRMADANKAKEMTGSQGMKDRMKKAGVIGMPSFHYLTYIMHDSSKIDPTARVMVTHKVKDWDAWKKEFDSHKQARTDAGLIDRVVAHNIDDNHMVTVLAAVTDMKKATDFFSSKDLKDKMSKAGVEGAPTVLYFNVVQRY